MTTTMLLTRKTDYALVALAGLARSPQRPQSARDLARQLDLPLPVLRNILKLLAVRGLLSSTRGPAGGYSLARDPSGISLRDVVEAIEGPLQLLSCCSHTEGDEPMCRLEDSCLIKGNVRRVHERLIQVLQDVSLDRIARPASAPTGIAAQSRTLTPVTHD